MTFIRAMKSVDALACVGSAIILLLVSAAVPLIGSFLSLLTPLPFLYYTTKKGFIEGIKIAAATGAIVGMISYFSGYPHLILRCLELSLLGLVLAEIFRRGFSYGYAVFWGTISMLLFGIIMLVMIGATKDTGPIALILDSLQGNLKDSILQVYPNIGSDTEEMAKLQEFLRAVAGILAMIYPALYILGTGFTVWLNLVISKPVFRLAGLTYPDLGAADRWRSPDLMVWGWIAAAFFSFILPIGGIRFFAVNILIVTSVIYMFHGISVAVFFFNKYQVPSWVRIGAYFLIFFQFFIVGVGLAMVGLFDQWIDFRKIHSKRVTE